MAAKKLMILLWLKVSKFNRIIQIFGYGNKDRRLFPVVNSNRIRLQRGSTRLVPASVSRDKSYSNPAGV